MTIEQVRITDGNATQVFYHDGCESFAPEIVLDVKFGFSNNITVQLNTRTSGRSIKIKFAILKKGLTSGMLVMISVRHATNAASDVEDDCVATFCFRVFSYNKYGCFR
ncbi:hypothetical protein OS493_027019 [Desmophyllum pertusum]|uniref:Uncharacterized protein n=1 Tax=Desmophyllum pertusum TaxID=174260 RepID=A0A9X0CL18_9CNID|nr:hypothetical protein OS493_027019 [Desmophyllum pertusum]